jgi:myo-inositol 2-dehydrogenase/D-chiro-inositol 1-dehydrogenase
MNQNNAHTLLPDSRRTFLKKSSLAVAAGLAAPYIGSNSFGQSNDALKVGLIGCGGRGTGAAGQALGADKNVALTAMGDVFESQVKRSHETLLHQKGGIGEKVKVDEAKKFVGLDAFEKVLNSGVDVVILATPPGFRPQHLKAAIAAGKHVFCEKPCATDAPGVRSVLASAEEAKKKNLALVAGFCWRYNLAEQALFQKIHTGAIGDVRVYYGTYYTTPVKPMPPASKRPPGMSDIEWQLRNWYNFVWLSGDGFVEQAVHAVDWMQWTFKDVPPIKCVAVGGRQIPANGGNIYDHIEANYEYADGSRGFLGQRQIANCFSDNSATIYGTKGTAREMGFKLPFIKGESEWRYSGERPDMYQIEHNELFASIRKGTPINNGVRLAHSTMAAIMGRMAAYTGEEITWEQALNSEERLVPEHLTWDMNLPVAPMAMPGQNKLV